jgi:orotidine-5'-phosphate decarboxylase
MQIDRLCESIKKKKSAVCVGLDTRYDYLPAAYLSRYAEPTNETAAECIFEYNRELIEEIKGLVPCVKVQAAFYEMYGAAGMQCFLDTMDYAEKAGLTVIADVKRNDIGSTAEAYSAAYILDSAAHFITVNAYLGSDCIAPFLRDCRETGKGIFVLVKTSNPSGKEIQDLNAGGRKVYEIVADKVAEWGADLTGRYGYSSVGAVVGATYPSEAGELRERLKNTFFLVPGYGAQGAGADDIAVNFDSTGLGAIINSSRGILLAYKQKQYDGLSSAQAARQAVKDMNREISAALKKRGIDMGIQNSRLFGCKFIRF